MSFNGSGTFVLPAGQPVVTATAIDSAVHNTFASDLATGLTNCLTRDGQSPPTANLPMGGFRHTGAGTATARTMLPLASQVQDDALIWGGTGGGTVDVITISTTPATTAHTTGAGFAFIASGANTGAVTLNPNSVGAKAVTKNGSTALAAGDIPSGAVVRVVYDGTRYQLLGNIATAQVSAGLLEVNVFTANGTVTKNANASYWIIEMVGGGGGGSGCGTTGASQAAIGGAGGPGAYRRFIASAPPATATVTIGAAGTGGTAGANNGTSGGDTIISGTGLSATAGGGGLGSAGTFASASTPPFIVAGPNSGATSGTTGVSTTISEMDTSNGYPGIAISATSLQGAAGGGTPFGLGGIGRTTSNDGAAQTKGFGCGGSGGVNAQSQVTARAGGNGRAGLLVCYQYKSP